MQSIFVVLVKYYSFVKYFGFEGPCLDTKYFWSFRKIPWFCEILWFLECHEVFGCIRFYGFEYHDIAKIIVFLEF